MVAASRAQVANVWKAWFTETWDASPAIDMAGNVQPALTDPRIANKRTYWESNGQITRRVLIM